MSSPPRRRHSNQSSPPSASVPLPELSNSSPPRALPPLNTAWSRAGTFYLSGSAAPLITSQYRYRDVASTPGGSSSGSPPSAPGAWPAPAATTSTSSLADFPANPSGARDRVVDKPRAVLMTEASCCCCGTQLRFPRGASSFRCGVCAVVGEAKGREAEFESDFVTAEEIQHLATVLPKRRPPDLSSLSLSDEPLIPGSFARATSSFASSLRWQTAFQAAEKEESDTEESLEAESLLLAALSTAFTSLSSLSRSFRLSTPPQAGAPRTADWKSLHTFYELVLSRPRAAQLLRERTEALLARPGRGEVGEHASGDGSWTVVLLESPLFDRMGTPNPAERQVLLSRFIGLVSNLPNLAHHTLVQYLAQPSYPRAALLTHVEHVVGFVSLRIGSAPDDGGGYSADWGVKGGARVGALLSAANGQNQRLACSAFYSTMCDSLGLAAMVDAYRIWEQGGGRFSLVQYPFLLSLGIKTALLAFDGQRQMEEQARMALRSALYSRQVVQPVLPLKVRREHLVADSFRQISYHREELKKSLRISFEGEDGVDAGGLRKEWFLLLCRQLFDPQFGMFLPAEEDSGLTYFNPSSFDADDYFLVGAVLGLAIYNSVTLDVPLPLAVYKKLREEQVTLKDLEAWQPALAQGFKQLLVFEPASDVEAVFCRSFTAEFESWGEQQSVELVPGGAEIAVTGENREQYVELMVEFLLSTHVEGQFGPFAEGFLQVVGGNALSLVKGEELELLVRGSPEPLDLDILRQGTVYEGFHQDSPTIRAFWRVFKAFDPKQQRQLLSFITGSDRIPATGSSALTLKISNAGPDETGKRFPTSHTCFDQLVLHECGSETRLRELLRRAMEESEGFGLR